MSNWQTATFFHSQNPTLKFSIKQMGQIAVFRYMVQVLLQSTTREITLYSKAELSQCNVILRNILAHQLNAAAWLPLTEWVCRLSDTLLTFAGTGAGPMAKSPVETSTHPQHIHRSLPKAAEGPCFDPSEPLRAWQPCVTQGAMGQPQLSPDSLPCLGFEKCQFLGDIGFRTA